MSATRVSETSTTILIEVACASVGDAVAAAAAGAHRIELCAALGVGGLTPSLGVFRAVRERVGLPIVCMVRPRPGSFGYDELELDAMARDVAAFREAGADGVVFGVLTPGGEVAAGATERLIEAAGPLETVFHRAFDVAADRTRALDLLLSLGATRVLTSGGERSALEGAAAIRRLRQQAGGRLEVLPGGGVRAANARAVLEATGADSLHLGPTVPRSDPSGASNPRIDFGEPGAPPGGYRQLDGDAVRAVCEACRP